MKKKNNPPPAVLAGLAPFDRRSFLGFAIAAGSTVLAGCAKLFGREEAVGEAAVPEDLPPTEIAAEPQRAGADQSLTPQERAVFEKLVKVIMPLEVNGFLDAQTIPVMENIDALVRGMPPFIRDRMNLALTAFDTGSILLSFKFRRFATLSDEEALTYVNAWHEGTFVQRGAITSLKSVVCVSYWRDQRAAARIDYDGPVTQKWGIPRLGNAPLPLDAG